MWDFRNVHNIFDVSMRLSVGVWLNYFFLFMGVDLKIEELNLSNHYSTVYGTNILLDMVLRAVDGIIYNIEFQKPYASNDDLKRFSFYNRILSFFFEGEIETIVINFTKYRINESSICNIGFSNSFHPKQLYLGDCEFEKYFRNIKKKVDSYIQTGKIEKLTPFEELALILRCLEHGFDKRFETLKWVCKVVQHKELFDKARYTSITSILKLELENLITISERKAIEEELGEKYKEVVKVSPEMAFEIRKTIDQVNEKTIKEAEDRGMSQGISKGISKGISQGISLGISQGEDSKESQMLDAIMNAPDVVVDENSRRRLVDYLTHM